MYVGKPPYTRPDPHKDVFFELLTNYKFTKFWNVWEYSDYAQMEGIDIPKSFRDIFVGLTCYDPFERLTITELKFNPWLQEMRQNMSETDIQEIKEEMKNIRV